jgi:hypothetical protein
LISVRKSSDSDEKDLAAKLATKMMCIDPKCKNDVSYLKFGFIVTGPEDKPKLQRILCS